jgi:hypothetical protein
VEDWPDEEVENLKQLQLPVSTEAITGRSGSTASSVALHEASHAVTCISLGTGFVTVTVVPKWIERDTDEGRIGQPAYGHVQHDVTERANVLENDPEAVVFETLAPGVACRLIGFSQVGLLPDYEQLALMAEKVFNIQSSRDELTPEALAWYTEMSQRTSEIVTPLINDIVRVAEQLDLRQTLSYEEVREVLRQA